MPSIKTLEVTARPAKKDGNFWVTSFWLFGDLEEQGGHRTEISGTDVGDFTVNAMAWMDTLELPEEFHGWSMHVTKPARWPNGFKAAFERNSRHYQIREAS